MSFIRFGAAPAQEGLSVLGKSETVRHLYRLLEEAREFVTLVSPYLSIEKLRDLERNIQSALKRKVKVVLFTRARDAHTAGPSQTGLQKLEALVQQGLKLHEVPDLHAKLYVSERCALVTSLNLIESSFNNSIEIGMWVSAQHAEYKQLRDFIQRELEPHARPFLPQVEDGPSEEPARRVAPPAPRAAGPVRRGGRSPRREVETGYCIRCGDELELNPDKPYCAQDYAVWARYSNPDYEDEYCHGCGEDYPATKNKPFCRDCYEQYEDLMVF